GGNINIPPVSAPHGASDAVFYYNQSTVLPGTSALSLYCLNNCPTATKIAGYTPSAPSTPYDNGTDRQWFSAPDMAHTVSYTFSAAGLVDGTGAPVTWEEISSDSMYAPNGL